MQVEELLDTLGYLGSPRFLDASNGGLASAADYGHIFRRAMAPPCSLRGVYTLKSPLSPAAPIVPVVYVCQAQSEAEAAEIHRLVWNQDVAPFLIVHTPRNVRLYSGFRFDRPSAKSPQQGALLTLARFNELTEKLGDFHSEAIDDARLWRNRGHQVTPERRVNWRLLGNLLKLDESLQQDYGLRAGAAHALIGKYVYLHYLNDRGILPPKLETWSIPEEAVFSRDATREGLESLVVRLDDWLNGSVFPLDLPGGDALRDEHVGLVAATFAGDQPIGGGSWQLHLDFRAYDFSFIPIETLSVVYEQFLHSPEAEGKPAKGKQVGAYYTPIPVVNLMLAEMEDHSPLELGKIILDPSCGSGAFLVQCYRRLIEKAHPPGTKPTPTQLKDILTEHIFGVDSDSDACSVAELSLILTLLDYVQPSDIESSGGFKLPMLRGKNIVHGNFFHEDTAEAGSATAEWPAKMGVKSFDWIVGNPPWTKLKPKKLKRDERPAWNWIKRNRHERPVARNQVAQAFAWKVGDHLVNNGEIGMLLPAMTLFEKDSRRFRSSFLARFDLKAVANFSNLAEILFAGRSRVPAAAFFYSARNEADRASEEERYVAVFSPLVANQEATRPASMRKRNESWSLVVNAGEIRDIPLRQLADGSALPWKLASWGTQFDRRLLEKLAFRLQSLGDLEEKGVVTVSQGLELRIKKANESQEDEQLEKIEDVVGKQMLDVKRLRNLGRFFAFPSKALVELDPQLNHARKGRAALPLSVCSPPHIIVSATRNFAVYSDEFIVIPPRQIGIASPAEDEALLKAMSLYLNSDFAFYHQFLKSPQFGVQRGLATLEALRNLPIPSSFLSSDLQDWARLHSDLADISDRQDRESATPLFSEERYDQPSFVRLLERLNEMTYEALGLDLRDRSLVHDLKHVRLLLNDGKLGEDAVNRPSPEHLQSYAKALKSELDGFSGDLMPERHAVAVVYDEHSGLVQIDLTLERDRAARPIILQASQKTARQLEETRKRLRKEHAQWVYHNRNLRAYEGHRLYLLKPMQLFHWTVSQAMSDALEIIADMALEPGEAN